MLERERVVMSRRVFAAWAARARIGQRGVFFGLGGEVWTPHLPPQAQAHQARGGDWETLRALWWEMLRSSTFHGGSSTVPQPLDVHRVFIDLNGLEVVMDLDGLEVVERDGLGLVGVDLDGLEVVERAGLGLSGGLGLVGTRRTLGRRVA